MALKDTITLKDDVDINDLLKLTPYCLSILAGYIEYAAIHDLPIRISSIISDRKNVNSKSKTHETGRAVDVSALGWTKDQLDQCAKYLNKRFRSIGAISASDFKPKPAVYGDSSHQDHIHLQSRFLTENEKKKLREEIKKFLS